MKVNLKVFNQTDYRTSDLKKLFKECMKKEGVNKCQVFVEYGKSKKDGRYMHFDEKKKKSVSQIHARARLNGFTVWVYFPKYGYDCFNRWEVKDKFVIKEFEPYYLVEVAQIFSHELHHNLGLNHKDMIDWDKINCDWAKSFVIRKKEVKEKPKKDLKFARYEKAVAKVQDYESKLRRIKNLLKKWQNKAKYYEKTYCFNNPKEKK